MAFSARQATLADRAAMRALLTTPVAGTSPLDELIADWGTASTFTAADLANIIADPNVRVLVCYDDTNTLRGFEFFRHGAGVPPVNLFGDAWEITLVVTDKSLAATDRLRVHGVTLLWGAQRIPPQTYIFGYVKSGGRLDLFLQRFFKSAPATVTYQNTPIACTVSYGVAQDVLNVAQQVTA